MKKYLQDGMWLTALREVHDEECQPFCDLAQKYARAK